MRIVVAVVVSVTVMVADHRYGHLESLRSALSTLVYPLQYVVNLPAVALHRMSDSLVTHESLIRENTRLKEEQ
ncbi:MAG: rod shape-determining protein MreC, partial [Gammaproteobacteria bacterium]